MKLRNGSLTASGSLVPTPGVKVIKLFSFSTQPSMKFILPINFTMLTIVGSLTFISRINDFIIYNVLKYRNILMKYFVYFIFSLVKI